MLVRRLGTERDRGLLPALWLLLLPLAYSMLSPPGGPMVVGNFGRYFFPLFAPLVVLGALGLEQLVERFRVGIEVAGRRLQVVPVLAVVVLLPTLLTLWSGAGRYALNVRNVEESDVAAARWVAENLPPEALLAVQDIGAIKYLTPNRIIDLVGIVNPEILPYIKGDRMGDHPSRLGGMFEYIESRGADYLILFPESYGGLAALAAVAPGLDPVYRTRVERNITMAGSELMVLRMAAETR